MNDNNTSCSPIYMQMESKINHDPDIEVYLSITSQKKIQQSHIREIILRHQNLFNAPNSARLEI